MSDIELQYGKLLAPSAALIGDLQRIEGDIIILGVGGKMGPALAKLAKQAVDAGGISKRIIGVSRFSDEGLRNQLEAEGVETIACDLLDERALSSLPDVKNVLYMAGTKFGTTGNESFSWAMNAYLPGRVAEKFRDSNIVVFSTGNVYPYTPVHQSGAAEDVLPLPVGEYGQSCLGRERIFQHFSLKYGTPVLIYRLNYAIDLKYGVLLEIGCAVRDGKPIDLSAGNVNLIWQGDANEMAIRSLLHGDSPAKILNVTGPETISVHWLANEFAKKMNRAPKFINEPQTTALLSNAGQAHAIFGYPRVTLGEMIDLTAAWLNAGGNDIGKPTHFQVRTGQY